jgi:hypothetical protein
MDLRFTPAEIAFRDEVREFFRTQIPKEIRRKVRESRPLAKACRLRSISGASAAARSRR